MLTIDYILLAVLIVSISVGIFRGFFKEALSLVTWVVALWASFRFAHLLEPLLAAVSSEALKMWAARIIAFILILIAGGLINRIERDRPRSRHAIRGRARRADHRHRRDDVPPARARPGTVVVGVRGHPLQRARRAATPGHPLGQRLRR